MRINIHFFNNLMHEFERELNSYNKCSYFYVSISTKFIQNKSDRNRIELYRLLNEAWFLSILLFSHYIINSASQSDEDSPHNSYQPKD